MTRSLTFKRNKHQWVLLAVFLLAGLWYAFCLPEPLFDDPYSVIIEDKQGALLGARIAEDGQWRFPASDSLPHPFIMSIVQFEDKRFYWHPGIDMRSIARAMRQNLRAGKVVSGGSTLSMQLIRLSRKAKPRTVFQKLIEAVLATRLELRYSKDEILRLYAAHAPFGGNVVGLETASWRYFEKPPHQLSWAESATLAVLPNSPALIHPGRHREALKAKRDRLLHRLLSGHIIDSLTYELSVEEDLAAAPKPMPQWAPHVLSRFIKSQPHTSRIRTTLDKDWQIRTERMLEQRLQALKANGIYNMAALVAEVETGAVRAYVGNVMSSGETHDVFVDVVRSPRSSGSILKPFLYALSVQDGTILPESLLPDIPSSLSNYKPVNFSETYDGAIPADQALVRSLNVPFVFLLQRYGLHRFHRKLREMGIQSLRFEPDHYGLPLILGGAEVTLWDLCGVYASLARTLAHFHDNNGLYEKSDMRPLHLDRNPLGDKSLTETPPPIAAAASYTTFEAMRQLERPNSLGRWEAYKSAFPIAWKTGTSYGFRDAWAVGVTPDYVVGIWAGNADGEGRPGLVGIEAAAPSLFDIFRTLPNEQTWFEAPLDEMQPMSSCHTSGMLASQICPKDTVWLPLTAHRAAVCQYHRMVHTDRSRAWQVHAQCYDINQILHESRFVLSPVQAHYYARKNPQYEPLPPFLPGCEPTERSSLQFIYPNAHTTVIIPRDMSGQRSKVVCKAAHSRPTTVVHWHLNRQYLGTTSDYHEMEIDPPIGVHTLTLVDENGYSIEQSFEVR